jgi:hypothetical protein
LRKVEVGGAAEKPGEMAEHLEKLVGGAIRRTSCGDLVEESCSAGEWCGEAARWRGGDLVEGGLDVMADFGENASLADRDGPWRFWGLPTPPRALGFEQVRRTKNHPVPDKK